LRHRVSDSEAALDRPALEGYTIGSGWGSRVRPGATRLGRDELGLCDGGAWSAVDELTGQVSLLRVLARRAPGGPPKAEPGAAPGRGGAQRSRLDI